MQILFDNFIKTSTLTASSVKINQDVEYVKHPHLSKSFSFDANSGNIVIDLGSEKTITQFILGGVNFTSTATAVLQGSHTDEWTAPEFTMNLAENGNKTWSITTISRTFRYWRIVVSDTTLSYAVIGYIYIGNHLQMPGINPEVELVYNNTSSVAYSVSMQTYGDIGLDYFTCSVTFPMITDYIYQIKNKDIATREDILEMWYTVKNIEPIYFVLFEEDTTLIPPILGLLDQNNIKFKFNKDQSAYSCSIAFQETK